jgi:UDP-N-acetylmuramate dehydrogenase
VTLSVRLAEGMARHTALRTGGECEAFVIAHDDAELATVVSECRRANWRVRLLGAGTRTVVRDGPVRGVVARLGGAFASLPGLPDDVVGAGVPMPALIARAARNGWSGLAPFATVAGSFGASLLHDDGWDGIVSAVYVLSRDARKETDLANARRKGTIVLGARLTLSDEAPDTVAAKIAAAWRARSPHAPGATVALPPRTAKKEGDVRAVLTSVRLPMVRLRDVAIPMLAPELLLNLGGGTAADLALLHKGVLERVASVRGLELASRLTFLGTDGDES